MSDSIRIKEDPSDIRGVPAGAHYSVHILKAIENFYISNNKINDIPESARGMVTARKAATMVNKELRTIPKSVANAAIVACNEVLNNGECMDQLPVDVYQGGVGTSVSMSTNEALTNIGLELMDHQKGEYQYLSPNDHVNKYQSINDVYPTGFRIAIYSPLIKLVDAINQLCEGFERKTVEFQDIPKMDCTQLQDAAPVIFDRGLRAFSILPKEEVKNIQRTTELLLEVNLGATAIGISLNTPKEYSPLAVKKLAEITGLPCVPAEDLIEMTSDCDVYVVIHGTLKRLAVKMPKVCNDLCSLSSGPRAGLSKINLLELQAGSSTMPAKVNSVVSEVVDQICFKAIGNDTTVTMAAEAGQLQLNVMKPATDQAMFEPVHIPTNACYSLLEKYISGITTNKEVCGGYVYNSVGIATYLNPFIGHHNGDIVDKVCAETSKSVYEVVLERGPLTEAELDNILSIQNLMHPTYKTKRCTSESE